MTNQPPRVPASLGRKWSEMTPDGQEHFSALMQRFYADMAKVKVATIPPKQKEAAE